MMKTKKSDCQFHSAVHCPQPATIADVKSARPEIPHLTQDDVCLNKKQWLIQNVQEEGA